MFSLRWVFANWVIGTSFAVDALDKSDVEAGNIKLERLPPIIHPSIPEEQKATFAKMALRGLLLSAAQGAWTVTDEWNRLLPGYKFTSVRDFAEALEKKSNIRYLIKKEEQHFNVFRCIRQQNID